MNFFTHSKNTTIIDENQNYQLDAHQVLYYNTGDTIVTVNDVPVFPRSTMSENDYSIIVYYKEVVTIKFQESSDTNAKNELFIIEKKYYPL